MAEIIDHTARARADTALTKIEGHEKTCGERWSLVQNQLGALFRGHRAIMILLLAGQGAVVLFLAGLIVTLVMEGRGP